MTIVGQSALPPRLPGYPVGFECVCEPDHEPSAAEQGVHGVLQLLFSHAGVLNTRVAVPALEALRKAVLNAQRNGQHCVSDEDIEPFREHMDRSVFATPRYHSHMESRFMDPAEFLIYTLSELALSWAAFFTFTMDHMCTDARPSVLLPVKMDPFATRFGARSITKLVWDQHQHRLLSCSSGILVQLVQFDVHGNVGTKPEHVPTDIETLLLYNSKRGPLGTFKLEAVVLLDVPDNDEHDGPAPDTDAHSAESDSTRASYHAIVRHEGKSYVCSGSSVEALEEFGWAELYEYCAEHQMRVYLLRCGTAFSLYSLQCRRRSYGHAEVNRYARDESDGCLIDARKAGLDSDQDSESESGLGSEEASETGSVAGTTHPNPPPPPCRPLLVCWPIAA